MSAVACNTLYFPASQVNATAVWEGRQCWSLEGNGLFKQTYFTQATNSTLFFFFFGLCLPLHKGLFVLLFIFVQLSKQIHSLAPVLLRCWITLHIHLPPQSATTRLLLFLNVILPAPLLGISNAAVLKDTTTPFQIPDCNRFYSDSLVSGLVYLGILDINHLV